jgi:hypothetical protein
MLALKGATFMTSGIWNSPRRPSADFARSKSL